MGVTHRERHIIKDYIYLGSVYLLEAEMSQSEESERPPEGVLGDGVAVRFYDEVVEPAYGGKGVELTQGVDVGRTER
jgi:hypothetical protein